MKVDTSNLASKREIEAKEIFYTHIVGLAQESLVHDGKLAPMVFIFVDGDENDKVGIVPMPSAMFMESEDKKEMLAEILREMAGKVDVLAIAMFSEAWMTKVNTETGNSEEKVEICFYSFESENIACMQTDEIVRGDDKAITLKKGEITNADSMEGKFVGFLKDLKKIKNN